jgi:protein O-GlcNAc transferase
MDGAMATGEVELRTVAAPMAASGLLAARAATPTKGPESPLELATYHFKAGRLEEAERLCQQRLRAAPGDVEALHLLGRIALAFRRYKIAAVLLGKAAASCPENAPYQRRLGEAILATGRPVEALVAFRKAAELDPRDARMHIGIARCLLDSGDEQSALRSLERALALDPGNAKAHHIRGIAELGVGRARRAAASFRRATALNREFADAHAGILFALHYLPVDRNTLLQETLAWAQRHAAAITARAPSHANAADPARRLKIGYVSGDFHSHPVGYFLEAVLRCHDRDAVEVHCYSNNLRVDETSQRLRAGADHWRIIWGMSDSAADELIRRDGIDVLVDLSGHTGANRLMLFARKPAPVQVSWLGYFDTTGMEAIDYLLADRVVCPEGDEPYYVEQIVRLPDQYLCFTPPAVRVPVVPPPSVAQGAPVTFGCFNNIAKITPDVAALWSAILHEMPDARLILKSGPLEQPAARRRFRAMFTRHGVAGSRIVLEGKSSHAEYLAAYGQVDVALDPFPYTGGTTTAEALWMGVPVVSLRGDRFVSRMCETYLTAVGLGDLVADSPSEYVQKAVGLARAPRQLARLRKRLRAQVEQSPLCDGPRFTRGLEAAYRTMWQTWCERVRS